MSDIASGKYPNLKGTIFIVTYGRSGSTLLQSLLQGIPGAHISGENYDTLYHLFRAFQRVSRSKRDWGQAEQPLNSPWYGADKLEPARFRKKLVDLFVEEVIQPPKDVRWYGFKEIRYVMIGDDFKGMVDFMRNQFPNAMIVFNSRNGADVAKSSWWKNQKTEDVLKMVETMDAKFAAYTKAHPVRSFHTCYEDILADPTCLKPLFDQLGEPFDSERARQVLGTRLSH